MHILSNYSRCTLISIVSYYTWDNHFRFSKIAFQCTCNCFGLIWGRYPGPPYIEFHLFVIWLGNKTLFLKAYCSHDETYGKILESWRQGHVYTAISVYYFLYEDYPIAAWIQSVEKETISQSSLPAILCTLHNLSHIADYFTDPAVNWIPAGNWSLVVNWTLVAIVNILFKIECWINFFWRTLHCLSNTTITMTWYWVTDNIVTGIIYFPISIWHKKLGIKSMIF